jgi:hypothetical protein
MQTQQVRGVRTSVRTSDGVTSVCYRGTDVVIFNTSGVFLNTGGWRSNTTKTRMMQAANQYGLGFRVFQRAFAWFVQIGEAEPVEMIGDRFSFNRADGRILYNGSGRPEAADYLNADGSVCETPGS